MKIQSALLAMVLAFGLLPGACSVHSDSAAGAGGSSGNSGGGNTGGSSMNGAGGTSGSGGGGGMSCSNVLPCGGDVVGTWSVKSSCLAVSGNVDLSSFGIGCTSASVTGSLQVTGTWTANSDGTYSDNTSTTGTAQISVPAQCLLVSGTTTTCERMSGSLQALGYASVNCTDAPGGGCSCTGTVQQSGGLGLVSADPQTSGNYATSGNVLTADDTKQYSYCVSGNQVTLTPKSTTPTMTGTIVLQNGGSTGAGGGGAGGSTGSGGGGTGGTTGSGGATGSGGRDAGSTTGTGGRDAGGTTGTGGGGGTDASMGPAEGPCDIYAAGNTPCVAAYSTTRVLSSRYSGPLYQVRRGGARTGTGGTLQDIGTVAGFADGLAQDAFCGTSTCTISKLYDQSGRANDLTVAPAGCFTGTASEPDNESDAKGRSLMISGHKVYAVFMVAHDGYRNNTGTGIPTGTAAQGLYEVADGKRIGAACCWDFGNASTNNCYGPTGSMNSLFFGTGFWGRGQGNGPWFMGDFEAGVWSGGSAASTTTNANLPASTADYAFGILKTSTANNVPQYAIRVGNAQTGVLTTGYDGQAPAAWQGKGGIILGIGGDNSNSSLGTFFEGAMTAGRPSDATDAAVLQNVQAVGYGR